MRVFGSLICYFLTWHRGFTAWGVALSTVFIASPDWNWSRRLWATGGEVDLIWYRGAASAPRCHLKHRGLLMRSSLAWRRPSGQQLRTAVPHLVGPGCDSSAASPSSGIRYSFCYYFAFIMCCVTSQLLLNFLPQYWHWLQLHLQRLECRAWMKGLPSLVFGISQLVCEFTLKHYLENSRKWKNRW